MREFRFYLRQDDIDATDAEANGRCAGQDHQLDAPAERRKMGAFTAPGWLTVVAGLIAAIIICLNVKLLWDLATG